MSNLSGMDSRSPKLAVIGAGSMGRNHLRVLNDLESVDLVGVADADVATAERVARRFHIAAYGSYADLLDKERPDGVVVAVPTVLHREVTLAAIARGVHVLVEKPIAFTVAEGQEMIEAARQAGVILTVGHIERYNPAILELHKRLREQQLGRVFQMNARRLGPFPPRVRDVGVVIDLATHDVDIMRFLSGSEVVRVQAETARRIHTEHEDLLSGLLRFGNDSIGVLDINWLTPTKIRELMITGERGAFQVNYLTQDLYFYENNYAKTDWDTISNIEGVSEGDMVRLRIEKTEPLRVELDRFARAIRGEEVSIVSGEDGLHALHVATKIVQSGLEGRAIYLSEEG
ncbi:MAG: Gfo/Idh/MocA family oxidoreductase [Chloroflexota bacterium]|nr:Gfo/Idh/MocA family oxidoreductase [Chloroflexota bacterium]MDQ5867646.1 Gfo/Idh/MocA family oxidoreductase [Chloroflexota bacterium]